MTFGVITLSWTFSGLLSMGPFPLLSGGGVTRDERQALRGDAPAADAIGLPALKAALASVQSTLTPKELTLLPFRGQAYWIASESPARHVLISATRPEQGPFARFDEGEMQAVARDAVPGAGIVDVTRLDRYDAYYYHRSYDRSGARPLPVIRVRYDDSRRTSIYLDPARGSLALVVRAPDRVNRWLYHGLHSLDVPGLYERRPAWDLLVIALSLGGITGAATSLVPAWRRLRVLAAGWRQVVTPKGNDERRDISYGQTRCV